MSSQKRHTNVNKSEKAVSSSKKKSSENIEIKQIESDSEKKITQRGPFQEPPEKVKNWR